MITVKKFFLMFVVLAILLPICGFADSSLEEIFKKKLEYTLEFDREEAEVSVCEKLGLKTPPPPLKSSEETKNEISECAKKLVDEKFPDSMKAQLILDAKEKFQAIKKGEHITVQIKVAQALKEYSGTYMGIFGGKIIVDRKEIRIDDLPPDILERLDENKIKEKQALHIKSNYSLPKLKYKEEMEKKLREKTDKEKEAYDKFQETMAETEMLFLEGQKLIALKRAIPSFIAKQEDLIAAEKDARKKLELYRKLAEDITPSIKGLGLDLGNTPDTRIDEILKNIEEYVKIKNEIIPKLEKEVEIQGQSEKPEKLQ